MLDCKDDGKKRALDNLKKPEIQEQLAETLAAYCSDLHDILTIATVHSAGVRPEGLSNEIYSCFHHIARGLCLPDADAEAELTAARKTHIKRAILDSYKIAINYILAEDNKLKEVLDYLVLAEDFSRFIPDGMAKVSDIKQSSRKVIALYSDAKHYESKGDFEKAIDAYNSSLEEGMDLLNLLELFTKDKVYLLACSRSEADRRERRKDRRATLFAALLGAVITAPVTIVATMMLVPAPTAPNSVTASSGQDSPELPLVIIPSPKKKL